jgi:phenylacetic acid degradation operon negative regulatory protein
VWLGSLIEMLAPFGVNDRLLRTSVFRLAQEGWLVANRDGRRSSYSITAARRWRASSAPTAAFTRRSTCTGTAAGPCCSTAGGALDAPLRAALRKELLWEGYAQIAPGVLGHPAGDGPALDECWCGWACRASCLWCSAQGRCRRCRRRPLPRAGGRWLGFVAAWPPATSTFIDQFEPLLALAGAAPSPALTPEQAFVIRTLLIHAYRRVQLHDPMLPVELLPDPWPGARAYELARQLYQAVYAAAEQHILATIAARGSGRAALPDAGLLPALRRTGD